MNHRHGITLRSARKALAELNEKLSSEHGDVWLKELNKFLRNESTWVSPVLKVDETDPVSTLASSALPIVLTVDYGKTLEVMIALGRYDWFDKAILSKKEFAIKGTGKVEYEVWLFHFGRTISSDEVCRLIREHDARYPWELGRTEHLLTFGVMYPEEQRKYPIVILGSLAKFSGYRKVLFLGKFGAGRKLGIGLWDGDWYSGCHFIAFRRRRTL